MRRLPHVSLILSIAVFMAADGVKKAESSSRRTDNSIGSVLEAAQWVSVDEGFVRRVSLADRFVLRVYSQKEVTRLTSRRAAYEKRMQEYQVKRKSLEERSAAIERQLPGRQIRADAKHVMSKYDANNNGVLDGEEQRRMKQRYGFFDANGDGKITHLELSRILFKWRRSTVDAKPSDVPKDVDKLFRELDSLLTQKESLTEQYKDVLDRYQAAVTYYKVIEVGKDFLRIRHKNSERIIPFASIREIRRTLDN